MKVSKLANLLDGKQVSKILTQGDRYILATNDNEPVVLSTIQEVQTHPKFINTQLNALRAEKKKEIENFVNKKDSIYSDVIQLDTYDEIIREEFGRKLKSYHDEEEFVYASLDKEEKAVYDSINKIINAPAYQKPKLVEDYMKKYYHGALDDYKERIENMSHMKKWHKTKEAQYSHMLYADPEYKDFFLRNLDENKVERNNHIFFKSEERINSVKRSINSDSVKKFIALNYELDDINEETLKKIAKSKRVDATRAVTLYDDLHIYNVSEIQSLSNTEKIPTAKVLDWRTTRGDLSNVTIRDLIGRPGYLNAPLPTSDNTVPNLSAFVSAQARGIIDDMATWFTVLQDCTLNIECQILWDAQNAYQTYQAGVHIRSAGIPDSTYILANTPTAPTNRMGVFDEVSALSTVTPPLALVNTGQAIHATISFKAGWAFSIYINASASLNIMNSFRGPECISYCAISRVA